MKLTFGIGLQTLGLTSATFFHMIFGFLDRGKKYIYAEFGPKHVLKATIAQYFKCTKRINLRKYTPFFFRVWKKIDEIYVEFVMYHLDEK